MKPKDEQIRENFPMGASQWRNHGIKYGYWKYFEREIREDLIKIIDDDEIVNIMIKGERSRIKTLIKKA